MASSLLNPTDHQGLCPAPFLAQDTFPSTGGFLPGRFCMPVPQLGNLSCCIPCPLTDWTYADGFDQRADIASWVNVVAFIGSCFLLLSFTFLPVKWTHRHYLGICLTVGIILMELAFIIPLAAKPEQCYNAITPNDMESSGVCAVSGALICFGGWTVICWIFVRALSLHLQICWEVIPGKKFFISSQILGWGVPVAIIAITLSLSGVSYRFGSTCHINHKDALQDFWGPLLAVAALALVLQFITLGYCIQVYLKSLWDDKSTTNSSLPQYSGSLVAASARQTYRRVKRVVELQWRGACIVLLIIAEVVFFSVVFVSMDNSAQMGSTLIKKAQPWLTCLALTGGNKNQCLPYASGLVKREGVVLAVLICLGMSGFWCLLFLGRWSMVIGWKDLIHRRLRPNNEFVSADARHMTNDPRTYEMLGSGAPQLNIKSPERVIITAPKPHEQDFIHFHSPEEDFTKRDFFHSNKNNTRTYVTSPTGLHPPERTPSTSQAREWDPKSTHAKGGLTALPRKSFDD